MWRVIVGNLFYFGFLFGSAGLLSAQMGPYQGMEPQRVSVEELLSTGMRFNETPVVVKGKLDYGDMTDQQNNIYEIEGETSLRAVRVATSRDSMDDLRWMIGREVEVAGIFFDLNSVMDPQRHPLLRYFPGAMRQDGFDKEAFIAVMSVDEILPMESDLDPDAPEEEPDIVDPDIDVSGVRDVDLRELVADPANYVDRQVVTMGKFRGNNLYGDLEIRDKRTPRDFVIKVADAAIWVTGRRPRGKDFRLDPKKRRDTGEWLRVFGTTWQHEGSGTYYLRAEKIELAEEPENEDLEPVKVVHESEIELGPPPEVTFSLPLEGERGIALDTEFHVQFSSPMQRDSFNRNVDLLYGNDDGIGNPFPDLEVVYDGDTRTLTVRPNKLLEPGQDIHLILYDAIEDEDGQKLVVDPGAAEAEPGAAVILTFATES